MARTVFSPVETTQVAPTILNALGLDPNAFLAWIWTTPIVKGATRWIAA